MREITQPHGGAANSAQKGLTLLAKTASQPRTWDNRQATIAHQCPLFIVSDNEYDACLTASGACVLLFESPLRYWC